MVTPTNTKNNEKFKIVATIVRTEQIKSQKIQGLLQTYRTYRTLFEISNLKNNHYYIY